MGIYADLSKWTPEQINTLRCVCSGDAGNDELAQSIIDALHEASNGAHTPSDVTMHNIAKVVEYHDTGEIDTFVTELELFMAYAKITEPLVVSYSNNAEGAEAHQGFVVVNSTCGVDGAQWSYMLLTEHVSLLRAKARIYEYADLIMSLPHVYHIAAKGHLLVLARMKTPKNGSYKRVYTVTPGHSNRWYIHSSSNLLAYTTGMDGKAGPNFSTLVGALDYIENVTNDITPEV